MISVCIPTYNGEKYIKEQLASILSQIGEQDEVIVSDDGSTDDTLSIIKSLHDPRIKVLNGPQRHSVAKNVETALLHTQGDYIFLADQDDVWKPHKVETCIRWLATYDCIVSDAEVTDSELNVMSASLYKMMQVRKGKLYNVCWKNGYTGCCMAFKRSVLKLVLPFPTDIPMHDIWIGNVAAFFCRVKFLDDKLIYFRRHDETNSCNGKGSRYSRWQQLLFRWKIIKNLILLKRRLSRSI